MIHKMRVYLARVEKRSWRGSWRDCDIQQIRAASRPTSSSSLVGVRGTQAEDHGFGFSSLCRMNCSNAFL